jgi:hypothetical protein
MDCGVLIYESTTWKKANNMKRQDLNMIKMLITPVE